MASLCASPVAMPYNTPAEHGAFPDFSGLKNSRLKNMRVEPRTTKKGHRNKTLWPILNVSSAKQSMEKALP